VSVLTGGWQLDFHQLEVFISVAKHKSFSKAAESIFLAQPTMSAHINSLESELQTSLFHRGNKGVTLTASGKEFYAHAINLLNMREDTLRSMDHYLQRIEGRFSFGVSTVPGDYLMPEFIQHFHEHYPDVIFHMQEMASGSVINKILEHELELGIVGIELADPKLDYLAISQDKLVLITPNSDEFLLWPQKAVSFADICHYNFVMRSANSGTRLAFERALSSAGKSLTDLQLVAELDSAEAIRRLVILGLGVAVVSERAALESVQNGQMRMFPFVEAGFSRSFYLVQLKRRMLSPVAQKFKESLISYFAASP
jgi:DNA-binding transcriptional LysR family regulator